MKAQAFAVLQDALAGNASRLIVSGLIGIKDLVSMLMQLEGVQDGEGSGESNEAALRAFLSRAEESA